MSQILLGSNLKYDVEQQTVFLFKIAVAQTEHQRIDNEQLNFNPNLDVESCSVGLEGNRIHRVVVEPCQLEISYTATVELTPATQAPHDVHETVVSQVPSEVLPYINPSRYCESDLLSRFAVEEFGNMDRGFQRVQAICDWVHDHLDYTLGSTTPTTTAADVLLQRTGVCRDYAHLAIALCRALSIPARYVSGYAVDLQPPDYHGFMEAFLDGQWYLFDPTKLASTLGLVRIGVGRDAADLAYATITGKSTLTEKSVWANDQSGTSHSRNPAVSTA